MIRPANAVLVAVLVAMIAATTAAGCDLLRVQPPPPPPGAQECIGVPEATCKEILQGRLNNRTPVALAGYRITCKAATCTPDAGDAEAALLWADGQTETFSYTWFSGQ